MIYFFSKKHAVLATLLFVFCANNAMESIIPYTVCGKIIKRDPAYAKVSVEHQPGVLFCADIWKEVGVQFLDANNEHSFVLHRVLTKWTECFSLNQYVFFVALISNIAKKTKFSSDLILQIINETDNNEEPFDFFTGVQMVKLYNSIIYKVQNVKKKERVFSADEYKFLNTELGNRLAVLAHGDKVKVERAMIERFSITPSELMLEIGVGTIINGAFCFVLEFGVFTARSCLMSDEEFEKINYNDHGIVGFKFLKCSQLFFLARQYYKYVKNNNKPVEKIYQPKFNELFETI